jgi:hypothetical protein
VDLRYEHVVVETDRYRIDGKLALPREGYRSRLSDYVNQGDREFFPILDAVAPVQKIGFALVARRQVTLIVPSEGRPD